MQVPTNTNMHVIDLTVSELKCYMNVYLAMYFTNVSTSVWTIWYVKQRQTLSATLWSKLILWQKLPCIKGYTTISPSENYLNMILNPSPYWNFELSEESVWKICTLRENINFELILFFLINPLLYYLALTFQRPSVLQQEHPAL